MNGYIQVGVMAMRDPMTGGFLPSVPLYVREEDADKVETPVFDDTLLQSLAEKFKTYKKEERKAKRQQAPARICFEPEGEKEEGC